MLRWITIIVILLSLYGCKCSSTSTSKLTKIAFKLNWSVYGEHAPFYVAREKGYFTAEGLDVEIITGNGSASTTQTVAEGSIPLGYADAATMIKQRSSGYDVLSIAVFTQNSPMALIYNREHTIKNWPDIKDKKVGMTVSDASSALFRIILDRLELKETDVRLVKIATPHAREKALVQEKVDGFFGYYINEPHRLKQKYNIDFGWLEVTKLGMDPLSSAIIVNPQFEKQNPDLVKRFLRAAQKGLRATLQDPDYAARILVQNSTDLEVPTAKSMIASWAPLTTTPISADQPLGWSARQDWEKTIEFLTKHYGFRGNRSPDAYFTNKYITDIKL